jgi:hypothetical protein
LFYNAAPLLIHRPALIREAMSTWKSVVPRRWWRRSPFLPVPDRNWIAFRMETAFGDSAAVPDVEALHEVLAWSAAFKRIVRERQRASQTL